jgi:hypothetical protein
MITGLTSLLSVVSGFAERNPGIVKVVLSLGALAAVSAAIAGGLAILGAAIPAVITGVSALGVVFAILTSPISLVVGGIGLITTGFLGLLAQGGKVASMFTSLGSTIDSVFGTTWGSDAAKGVMDFAKDIFGSEENKLSVEKTTKNNQSVEVNGNLRVQAEPGTKILGGSMKKSSSGDLGMTIASAFGG